MRGGFGVRRRLSKSSAVTSELAPVLTCFEAQALDFEAQALKHRFCMMMRARHVLYMCEGQGYRPQYW